MYNAQLNKSKKNLKKLSKKKQTVKSDDIDVDKVAKVMAT